MGFYGCDVLRLYEGGGTVMGHPTFCVMVLVLILVDNHFQVRHSVIVIALTATFSSARRRGIQKTPIMHKMELIAYTGFRIACGMTITNRLKIKSQTPTTANPTTVKPHNPITS